MNGFSSPYSIGSGGGMFELISTLFPILFIVVLVIIIVKMVGSGARYMKNANSPRDSRFAKVVSKRMDVHQHSHMNSDNHMNSTSSRTYYYITLEFDNGERQEYLDVKNLYGLVVEGDTGYAAIQGDWIVAFERNTGGSPEQARY
ncbi:DUF2500 domain-containing protein [Paenibacillus puldeungensis]|uniref:DUF2500 domain-containing protein n=1 Tax=Paenibacillus puldeungensis TaxID=696536 RepID=A0ABW3RY85_9BACL